MVRGRKETLWTEAQLAEAKISQRVKASSDWMKLKLPGKDLLIIGFWTDWGCPRHAALSKLRDGLLYAAERAEHQLAGLVLFLWWVGRFEVFVDREQEFKRHSDTIVLESQLESFLNLISGCRVCLPLRRVSKFL